MRREREKRRTDTRKRDMEVRLSARRKSSRFLLDVEAAQETEKRRSVEREQTLKEEFTKRYSYAGASSATVSTELKIQVEKACRELFEIEARAKEQADRLCIERLEKRVKRDSMLPEFEVIEKATAQTED